MTGLLAKLLDKWGIKDVKDLSAEEKATFDNYEKVLSKETLTLEDMGNFLGQQLGIIEGKWRDHNIEQAKKAELLPYHTTYKALKDALTAPQVEREALEQYLNQLIK